MGEKKFVVTFLKKLVLIVSTFLDLDKAPQSKNISTAGQAVHALSLPFLVEEIMESEDDAVITYHTDGFRAQCIKNYSVQEIAINGKYRSLQALAINNECRINLCSGKKTVLCVLSTVSSLPIKAKFKRISCQMTLSFLFL